TVNWQVTRLFSFEYPTGISADQPQSIGKTRAITNETTCSRVVPQIVNRRKRVLGSERYNLITLSQKKWISLDYERSTMLRVNGGKTFREVIPSSGFDNNQPLPECVRSRLHIARVEFCNGIVGIYEKGYRISSWDEPVQDFQLFRDKYFA
ncbi:MAG: hypothetical protein WAK90_01090, partial [Pseudolabrys sp.]